MESPQTTAQSGKHLVTRDKLNFTTVDLTNYGGNSLTLIRGHNLVPLVRPYNGQQWFAAKNTSGSGTPDSDANLLYSYTDHEFLFAPVQSLKEV